MTDQAFLRDVQAAGWIIKAVDEGQVIARCPRDGCPMLAALKPGGTIPNVCRSAPSLMTVPVDTYAAGRQFLRARREELGLSIAELEECIGLTKDHLAKMEPDDPQRIPNIMTFIEWAQGLGFRVQLQHDGLPPVTLRTVAQTRDRTRHRFRLAQRLKIARSAQASD